MKTHTLLRPIQGIAIGLTAGSSSSVWAAPTFTPREHGGNLEDGGLAIADRHCTRRNAEVSVTAVEMDVQVTAKASIVKDEDSNLDGCFWRM
ncbi:MAG TPA: hypothetical protein VIS76_17430 [Pseudomonadales bacterium]